MRLFGQKTENRATDYTSLILAGLAAANLGSTSKADALSVVESCVSLICDPLLVAEVEGLAIPRHTLYTMARDLLRNGNAIYAINTTTGQLRLERAYFYDVIGDSPHAEDWLYRLEIAAPGGTIRKTLPSTSVIALHLNAPSKSPWAGLPPWASAPLTASALAELEQAVKEESHIAAGRIWVASHGATESQVQAMGRTVASIRGGSQVVAEASNPSFGGRGENTAAINRDWKPVSTGPQHDPGNTAMRESIQSAISASYGVPALYHSMSATAPGVREVKRLTYLNRTLPVAEMLSEELSAKLLPVRIHWVNIADQSVDVAIRGRAAAQLRDLGEVSDLTMLTVGLPRRP